MADGAAHKVAIITGINPYNIFATEVARLLLISEVTHIGLLGCEQSHIQGVATSLEAEHPNITVLAQEVDITKPESLGIASHHIRAQLGAWDLFVHIPGGFAPVLAHETTIRGADEADWWATFERNVRSLHFIARHFFPKMKPNSSFVLVLDGDKPTAQQELGKHTSASEASALAATRVLDHLSVENSSLGSYLVEYVGSKQFKQDVTAAKAIQQWYCGRSTKG